MRSEIQPRKPSIMPYGIIKNWLKKLWPKPKRYGIQNLPKYLDLGVHSIPIEAMMRHSHCLILRSVSKVEIILPITWINPEIFSSFGIFFRQKPDFEFLLLKRHGIEYAVPFGLGVIMNGYHDYFTTYRMIKKYGRPQESILMNDLIVYGERFDWHEQSGEGYFLCSSFLYPSYNPQAPGQPAYEMVRQRFVVKDNQISDIVLEMEKTVYSA